MLLKKKTRRYGGERMEYYQFLSMWYNSIFSFQEQKYNFKNETSTYTLWKPLDEKFLKKISQNCLYMKKKLFRFDYQPGTTINEHITTFNQLVEDLLSLDEPFKDEDLVLMLL